MIPLGEQIKITLSLMRFRMISRAQLVAIEAHHGNNPEDTELEINRMILSGELTEENGIVCLCGYMSEPIPQRSLAAADAYKSTHDAPPWLYRAIYSLLTGRFAGGLWLILSVLATFVFCLILAKAYSQEMPPWVMRGMLARETSSHYQGGAIVYRNQKRGTAGEVGCFQALPSTLRDKRFRFSPSLFEQSTDYAEQATRYILAYYYSKTGSWEQAVCAWRGGLSGRGRPVAIAYLKDVQRLGSN